MVLSFFCFALFLQGDMVLGVAHLVYPQQCMPTSFWTVNAVTLILDRENDAIGHAISPQMIRCKHSTTCSDAATCTAKATSFAQPLLVLAFANVQHRSGSRVASQVYNCNANTIDKHARPKPAQNHV